jgi:hypothetical protein
VARPCRLRRLDLDHVGAHVGEQRAGERTGKEVRELDDPYPASGFGAVSSFRPRRAKGDE